MAHPLLICRVQARGGLSKTSTPCSSRCRGSTRVICPRPNASPCLKKWKIAAKILPYMAILARKFLSACHFGSRGASLLVRGQHTDQKA